MHLLPYINLKVAEVGTILIKGAVEEMECPKERLKLLGSSGINFVQVITTSKD